MSPLFYFTATPGSAPWQEAEALAKGELNRVHAESPSDVPREIRVVRQVLCTNVGFVPTAWMETSVEPNDLSRAWAEARSGQLQLA